MPNDVIEIKDFDLARVIREQLEKSGKRDNRLKTLVYGFTFTKDELASITSLKLKDGHFGDISELKYLTNLEDLEISSVNAKDVSPKFRGGLQPQYRYDNAKIETVDFSVINSKDNALTALIHLGYLEYDNERKKAYIPNYEVSTAFQAALGTGSWSEIAETISRCDELLWATIDGDAERAAELNIIILSR